MPKTYNINDIRLLTTQMALRRNLKKGDFITVGPEVLSEAEQILRGAGIAFSTNEHAFGIFLITVN